MKFMLLFAFAAISNAAPTHYKMTTVPMEFLTKQINLGISLTQLTNTLTYISPRWRSPDNCQVIHALTQTDAIVFIAPTPLVDMTLSYSKRKYALVAHLSTNPILQYEDYVAKIDEYTALQLQSTLNNESNLDHIFEFVKRIVRYQRYVGPRD